MVLLMRRTLGLTLLFGCLGLFSGRELRADSVTTYNFSARLINPAGFVSDTISGQFTLDTTTGTASAYLIGATPNPLTVGTVYSLYPPFVFANFVELQFSSNIDPFEVIALYYQTTWNAFDPSTLYLGPTGLGQSTIAILTNNGYNPSYLTNASTTVAATPEPSSLYLILCGIVGIVVIRKVVR